MTSTLSNGQDQEKKTLTTSPFIGVKVFSGLELRLISSDVNKAVVIGPQSDDVILSIRNEILQVKIAFGSISNNSPTYVDLYYSKFLNDVSVYQGSKLTSNEPIRQTSLTLKSNTGGVIDLEIYADRLDVMANTGGRLELKGVVSNFNLIVNAGGSCEAELLQSDQIKTKLIGGGYAYVLVSKLLDAQVLGGSVLRVYGDPVKKIYQQKLGGKVYFKK